MNLFVLIGHIFMNSMIPILILIGVGFILDRKFKLDLYTLSKLNFYILLPTFIFRAMYEAKLNSGTLEIVFVAFCVLILNSILSDVVGRMQGYDVAKIGTLKTALCLTMLGIWVSPLLYLYLQTYPMLLMAPPLCKLRSCKCRIHYDYSNHQQ